MIKDLIIISPDKAKEINPYGEKPEPSIHLGSGNAQERLYLKLLQDWQEAESKLNEYTIIGAKIEDVELPLDWFRKNIRIGTITKAQVNEQKQTCIIL